MCDEQCENGEETITRLFAGPRGEITYVHGPRTQVEALNDIDPGDDGADTHIRFPVRPGRAAIEARRRALEAKHPGCAVVMDCWGAVVLLPAATE
ncbi:hypothetical protein AB0O47_39705 [Streptomyces noursei]|uniref:hypothetical protein n=1 Tax=Streptomyces noursei TaxID=1971 RepID=UPI00344BEDA6